MKSKKRYTKYIITYLDERKMKCTTIVRAMALGLAQSKAAKKISSENKSFKILSTERHIISSKSIKIF